MVDILERRATSNIIMLLKNDYTFEDRPPINDYKACQVVKKDDIITARFYAMPANKLLVSIPLTEFTKNNPYEKSTINEVIDAVDDTMEENKELFAKHGIIDMTVDGVVFVVNGKNMIYSFDEDKSVELKDWFGPEQKSNQSEDNHKIVAASDNDLPF